MQQKRRAFLMGSGLTALAAGRAMGANERIRIGGLGTGGRCTFLLSVAAKEPAAEVVAVADVWERRRRNARERTGGTAQEYGDYRQVLERKDIDAVIVGSPDHWHTPMALDAVAAGKDVYLEKPVSHSIEEGERLEKAVLASRQVFQAGYQQRSWEHFIAGREIVASGKLGKISLVLASWYQNYLRNTSAPAVDAGQVDWKAFLGAARERPFDPLVYWRWRWFWDFGGGHLTDLYSHYGDVIQWYMGEYAPRRAQAMGMSMALPRFECPDTITASWEYPGGWMAGYSGTLSGSLDGGNIVFRGSRAMMKINRDGLAAYPEGVVPGEKTHYPEPEVSMRSTGDGTPAHVRNFLDCVRSRKTPNADVKSAVAAARAAHMANIALRNHRPFTLAAS